MADAQVSMSQAQFEQMIIRLAQEMRKAPIDPIKEKQKEREQKQKADGLREYWNKKLWKLIRCAHSRQDGTCIIGWARQSDNVERGYCPNCDNMFGPELAQLDSLMSKEMKELCPDLMKLYADQRKRPRGLMESVRYIA